MFRRPCNLECRHCSKVETKENIIDVRLLTITSYWDPEELRKCRQEDPDLKCVIHGLEMNKRPTRGEIAAESPVAKAYWAQKNSLKLVSGCLHRVWERKNGQTSRALIIVPKVRNPEVLNELHNFAEIKTKILLGWLSSISYRVECQLCRVSLSELLWM